MKYKTNIDNQGSKTLPISLSLSLRYVHRSPRIIPNPYQAELFPLIRSNMHIQGKRIKDREQHPFFREALSSRRGGKAERNNMFA
mmetsp:Transcript_21830/g.36128  ORF Transcript_21830/g.36128 Transcript_21830/m.36128 type:complete len:85 (+) Transcript_21830:149-403(+)